ncbi:MAG: histidine kinase [Acidobacteriota bacterium]|jgi:signal transduction histidine kinase
MSESARSKSLFRIAVTGLARTPRRRQLILAANIVLLLVVATTTLLDLRDGENAAAKIAGLTFIMSGAVLLTLAATMFVVSQGEESCSIWGMKKEAFTMRARKLDEVLIAYPVLAFLAGCIIAAGFGMFAALAGNAILLGAIVLIAAWFLAWTSWMIALTTRFLYSHAREQAEAAARARGEATEAQLAALQAQMNPHFLFNTLNTVASLVRTDSAAAEATVENLAVVLRRTLDRSRDVLSTVDDEIDHLAAYLSVAKQRFEDRLQVHWTVDPRARDLLLPTMTLQPLVENALKHGPGARLEGGALHIGIHLEEVAPAGGQRTSGEQPSPPGGSAATESVAAGEGWRLVLEVADDGPGFPRRHLEGTGLSNLRTRLATLYGDAAQLTIDRDAPGARVIIKLPVVRSAREVLGESADAPTVPAAVEAP